MQACRVVSSGRWSCRLAGWGGLGKCLEMFFFYLKRFALIEVESGWRPRKVRKLTSRRIRSKR